MTYREAIKESCENIKEEIQGREVEILPVSMPVLFRSMAVLILIRVQQILEGDMDDKHFKAQIHAIAGTDFENSMFLTASTGSFVRWLFDQELPEEDEDRLWFEPETIIYKWNEYVKIQNGEDDD